MRDDLSNRSFPGFGLPLQLLWSQAMNQFLQLRRGSPLYFDCVLAFHVAQDSLDILLRCLWHIFFSVGLNYFSQTQPPRDRRRNSSTASTTAFAGTSVAISTLPISRGKTKCTTPFCVFLSDCIRARILRELTFSSGSRPRLNTASAMRPAVTLSVRPTLSAMLVAAIIPQATASPCSSRR